MKNLYKPIARVARAIYQEVKAWNDDILSCQARETEQLKVRLAQEGKTIDDAIREDAIAKRGLGFFPF